MKDFLLRNIPAKMHKAWKAEAARQRRAMRQVLLAALEDALARTASSSNGRTPDFGSENAGSTPAEATTAAPRGAGKTPG